MGHVSDSMLAVMNYTEMEAKVSDGDLLLGKSDLTSHRFVKLRITNRGGHHPLSCRRLPMELIASWSIFYNECKVKTEGNNSQLLNEIMPMIYKRFTDKAAEEWRQIYKVCLVV